MNNNNISNNRLNDNNHNISGRAQKRRLGSMIADITNPHIPSEADSFWHHAMTRPGAFSLQPSRKRLKVNTKLYNNQHLRPHFDTNDPKIAYTSMLMNGMIENTMFKANYAPLSTGNLL